jgi:hypothetical protein
VLQSLRYGRSPPIAGDARGAGTLPLGRPGGGRHRSRAAASAPPSALALAEAGADVVLAARSKDQLQEVAGRSRTLGRRAVVVPADLADLDAVSSLATIARDDLGGSTSSSTTSAAPCLASS